MSKDKPSFFERLTGSVRLQKDDSESSLSAKLRKDDDEDTSWTDKETEQEGELTVDVYQTPEMIVIKSMIAGVRPEDLDISITRDLVTIRGKREEEQIASDDDFFTRELYWGSFSRTVTLPVEIDVDEAEAIEKHGLLILKLPKLDKKRKSKLKVKTA
ncbi:MAG: Hsp20/alpha crystallin family protein [Candidatus Paceibacterota bacterium]